MNDSEPSRHGSVWKTVAIGACLLYIALYVVVRMNHFLVNFSGNRDWYGVRMFDPSGITTPQSLMIGKISLLVFFPLHRIETLVRHGPMHALRSY